jgi:RNA-binding protein
MPTTLAASQKRYLRSLAHSLKPVILVGAKGVSPSVLSELDGALEHHELIKVRVVAEDRETRDAWIDALLEGSDAVLVQRIGHIACLYRPRLKDPAIVLPRKS